MSKIEKLKKRLMQKPNDFTFAELCTLLRRFGYELESGGKTGGSRRKFFNERTKHVISLHEPHPSGILKSYQINNVLTSLQEEGLL